MATTGSQARPDAPAQREPQRRGLRARGEVPGTPPTPGMAPDGVSVVHSDTKNP